MCALADATRKRLATTSVSPPSHVMLAPVLNLCLHMQQPPSAHQAGFRQCTLVVLAPKVVLLQSLHCRFALHCPSRPLCTPVPLFIYCQLVCVCVCQQCASQSYPKHLGAPPETVKEAAQPQVSLFIFKASVYLYQSTFTNSTLLTRGTPYVHMRTAPRTLTPLKKRINSKQNVTGFIALTRWPVDCTH